MKTGIIFLFVLAVSAAMIFFAPQHRREPESFRPTTLGAVYRKFWSEMPARLNAERVGLALLGLSGMFAGLYPALLVLLVYGLRPVDRRPSAVWFVVMGLIAGVGVAANFLAMLISHMNFAFGGRSSNKTATFFIWLVPFFQGVFAIGSIMIGFSGTCAGCVGRLLSN